MKVLLFGPSGAGKTFVANEWKRQGIPAFEEEDIEGLANWYNREGRKVAAPATADEALNGGYAFLWSKKAMAKFLNKFDEAYVFGGSGNIKNLFDLFDRVYFLQVSKEVQQQRLRHAGRPSPAMDENQEGLVIWGDWFEEMASANGIPFIDAEQSPMEIYGDIKPLSL